MRLLRWLLVLLLVLAVAATIWGLRQNPEHQTLNAAARAGVAGQFVGGPLGVTHYEVTGPDSGSVVVLVHGFSVPMYIWDSLFTTLGDAGYRTIRYDVLGRGWSDRPDVPYDGSTYDAQLEALLDSLHVTEPAHVIGLSFGGFVTGHFTATHRSRVASLTLIDPAASSSAVPKMLHWPVLGSWIWQTTQVPHMAEGQSSDFLHPEHFPGWPDAYRPQMQYKGFGRALLRTVFTSSRTSFDSLYGVVGRTGVPTLLVWGRQDPTVRFALSDNVRRAIPQAEFFPVDSSGHLPHMEQAPQVRERVLRFLGEQ
ncbi:MAG: alpha/beta hydrolase [Gemmatimonadales bacterium]